MGFFKIISFPFRMAGKGALNTGKGAIKTAEHLGNRTIPNVAKFTAKTTAGGLEIGIDEAIYYANKLGKGVKNIGEKTIERVDNSDHWFGYQIKKPYATAIALGAPVVGVGIGLEKNKIESNNRMHLGAISPELETLPNQVTVAKSSGFYDRSNKHIKHQRQVDTLGADGQLAMSLHYLNGR
jgi:hypothetical protein